ncbi:murein hydrolase activator EnvC [Kordiimonas sp. SCSIO 12610]|uniref:murein hydrolase activator EnvC family protein n=1 Tax=Kordiimonas sp. SCSIO 12610 TaxID=2829597 RepID=UPI0021094908|nr:peptidoglycan DD-metalloendopeptidase family protein [Kordiimonas sp. SCSIO 12610]UTW55824.1 peptidoglycan DD-metalloendopeptidase family protein [Kordiimonas sp. SCSIO 12610]
MGLTLGASTVVAQTTPDDEKKAQEKLEQIQSEIEAASAEKNTHQEQIETAENAVASITEQMIALGTIIKLTEDNATRIEANIKSLESEEEIKSDALKSRQQELSELLAALERLSRRPAVLALLQPKEAVSTARSASLMSTIVPEVNAKADALKNELSALTIIQNNLIIERSELDVTLTKLEADRSELSVLVNERKREITSINKALRQDEKRLQDLANEAKNLQDLLAKINERNERLRTLAAPNLKPNRPNRTEVTRAPIRRPNTSGRNFADAKGLIPYPASGSVVSKFGQQNGALEARGIQIQGRPGGQVISPFDGQIVFTGPFRNYGNLLIIEHGEGYHTLLAGLGQIYGGLGQWVLTGEPVGVLENSNPTPLYLELRRKGKAIDPLPWLQRQQASTQ